MSKKCVITLGKDETRDSYLIGIDRLELSLKKQKFEGDILAWRNCYPADCPSHFEAPMAFKPFCFLEAKKQGYDLILWLDASVIAVKRINALFKLINRDGYVLFRNPGLYSAGQWCSDFALEGHGLNRDEALTIPELSSGAIGLNMRNPIAIEFLDRWHRKALDGFTFRGVKEPVLSRRDYSAVKWNKEGRASTDPRVYGHRHDQSAAGIIAYQLGMSLLEDGFAESGVPETNARNTIIYAERNLKRPLHLFWCSLQLRRLKKRLGFKPSPPWFIKNH